MATWWTAKSKQNTSIVSVLAENEQEAKRLITDQLKMPGRGHYLKAWQEDGEMVEQRLEEKATQQVDPFADDFEDSGWCYI